MKCKKIFAMLLALCMVLSTFTMVSAADDEKVVAVDMKMTMDNEETGLLFKNSTVTYEGGIATAVITGTGNNDMVGVKFVDILGGNYKLKTGDIVKWSIKLNPSVAFKPIGGNATKGILMRNGGDTYPPALTPFKQIAPSNEIPADDWTTLSGEWICDKDYPDVTYMNIRPDTVMTLLVDEITVEVRSDESPEPVREPEYETVVNMTKTMDDADTGLLTAKKVTDFEYKDGIAFANLTSADGDSMVGFMLVDEDGKGYTIKKGDIIEYSALIKPSKTFKTRYGNVETAGIFIRSGTSYVPADKTFSGIHPTGDVPGGDWVTLSGKWTCDRDYLNSTYFNIRPNTIMTLEVDEVTVTVKKEFVPDITNIKVKSVAADSAKFTVKTNGYIDSRSIKNYCEIDGVKHPSNKVFVNTIDENEIEVIVKGLTAGMPYDFTITGAKSLGGSDVAVDCTDTVEFKTLYEVSVAAEVDDTVSYTLTNNTGDDVDAYAVLLRCKDNTVVATEACALVEIADEESGEFEVDPLASGEYFRLFVWSYDGAIRSLAELKDLK